MADIFNTAVSGLLAYRSAITTTSNNITNVNTEGYSRQRVLLESRPGEVTSAGTIGTGVNVASIERLYSQFDNLLINQYQSSSSRLEVLGDLATRIDDVVADPDSNLTPAMDGFFSAINDVANDPTSISPRQVLLGEAEVLVERFHFLSRQMNQLDMEVDTRLSYVVSDINALASDVANLNNAIVQSTSLSSTPPSDLLDQRDLLLKELSKKVEVKAVEQSSGAINVFIGTGQLLVSSGKTFKLEVNVDEAQPDRYSVYLNSGFSTADISKNLTGGEVGGLLDFRKNILDPAMNRLGRISIAISSVLNEVHRAGLDLNGNVGDNFFAFGTQSPQITNNSAAGDLLVEVGSGTALANSGYRLEYIDDGVNPANYNVYRLSDNSVQNFLATAAPFVVDGLTFTPSGTLTDGESFVVNAGPPLAQVLAHADNSVSGDLEVQINDVSALTNSNYLVKFDFGRYTVTRLSDNADVTPPGSAPLQVDGMLIIPNSGVVDGDSFYVRPTRNAALEISVNVESPNEIAMAFPYRAESDVNNIGNVDIEISGIDAAQLDFISRPATLSGTVATAAFDFSASNASFDLTIDGVTRTVSVNLDATTDLNGDLATDALDTVFAVQSAIDAAFSTAGDPSATVALNGNNLSISSDSSGANSSLAVANSDAVAIAQLGIDTLTATGDSFTANIVFKDAVLPATGIVFDVLDTAGNPLTDNTGALLQDVSYAPGMSVSVGAWTARLTGNAVAEDRVSLSKNNDATQDNRNAIVMSLLESQAILDAGTSSFSQAYGALIADVGTQTAQVAINRDAENVLLSNAVSKREETSGVNLDEEAADLIRFQQAYTAITHVIQTARTVFQSLLDVV
ncbi:MAG: flagellar hook-associated protein FlgK [Gammaproteobacteria bacterium]|nr:flagellar hook-associated protein FlgK [Gammaproteobacteria bacterium]